MFPNNLLFFISCNTDRRHIYESEKAIIVRPEDYIARIFHQRPIPLLALPQRFERSLPLGLRLLVTCYFSFKRPINNLIICRSLFHTLFQFLINLINLFPLNLQLLRQEKITPGIEFNGITGQHSDDICADEKKVVAEQNVKRRRTDPNGGDFVQYHLHPAG